MGTIVAVAATLALAACGARDGEAPPAAPEHIYGWTDADSAEGPGVTFVESPATPGFQLRCVTAAKALRVTVANTAGAAPAANETAALQLGVQQFDGVAAGGPDIVSADFPLVAQLLVALGDAKTARLTYRDMVMDAGVDSDGRIAAFAARCATATGVEPALQ